MLALLSGAAFVGWMLARQTPEMKKRVRANRKRLSRN
jgi:hypothetical protein